MEWRQVNYVLAKRNTNGLSKKVFNSFFSMSYRGLRNKCGLYSFSLWQQTDKWRNRDIKIYFAKIQFEISRVQS